MANMNAPFGLRLVGMLTGEVQDASIRRYRVPASVGAAVGVGTAVTRINGSSTLTDTNASLNQEEGLLYVGPAAGVAGEAILGVVTGVCFNPANLSSNYSPGGVASDVLVCDDPQAIYEVQSNATGVTNTQIGMNCLLQSNAVVNAVTGQSGGVLSTPTSDDTCPLLMVGWSRDPKNDITSPPYVKALVKINIPQLEAAGSGAKGV